jgi:uncharacterized protein
MAFGELPRTAAWRHHDARDGFEVVFLDSGDSAGRGYRVEGQVAGVEDGVVWAVHYVIALDPAWRTRTARVRGRSPAGRYELRMEADGDGHWLVDGTATAQLDGCLDVDLEASSFTNAFPVHRLGLAVGADAQAPAAYVRAETPTVERLEQRYVRLDDDGTRQRYDYTSPAFGFRAVLGFDEAGLVLDYPGIATRVA